MPTSTRPRPTVGLLLDALYNEYASMVVGAFDAECARRGLDLLCFAGGSLQSSAGYEKQRNRCFDLAGKHALDGLVALNLNTTAPVMKEFLDSFQGLPICSVGIEVPGYSVVQADNAAGMRDAVLHLITVHNRRKIAFLRGPTDYPEAEVRFEAYRDALVAVRYFVQRSARSHSQFQREPGLPGDDRAARPRGLVRRRCRRQ